jgi:P-type E1-E2 ATPase
MRALEIPGEPVLVLEHLVLDVNGTLTRHGELIDGVAERLRLLANDVQIHLLTADTLGTAGAVGRELGLPVTNVQTGREKAAVIAALGPERAVAIGNGRNDIEMLRASRLAIAIVGPEGAAPAAISVADVVCRSITDALDLLLDHRLLIATLRQ